MPATRSAILMAVLRGSGSTASVPSATSPITTTLLSVPEAGPLPERDPKQQHGRRGGDVDGAERQRYVPGHALVEHIPRHVAQPRPDQHGHAHAVADQAGVELDESPGEPVANLRHGCHSEGQFVDRQRANFGDVAMTTVLQGPQLARLLGRWQGGRSVPDYAALAATVRGLLTDGRLPLGVRLPAERELAQALRISRTTVSAAYRLLRETGHLTSRRGAGSWTAMPGGARVTGQGVWTPEADPELLDLATAAMPAPPQLAVAATEALTDLPRYLAGAG